MLSQPLTSSPPFGGCALVAIGAGGQPLTSSTVLGGSMLSPQTAILNGFSLCTPFFLCHFILLTGLAGLNISFFVTANLQIGDILGWFIKESLQQNFFSNAPLSPAYRLPRMNTTNGLWSSTFSVEKCLQYPIDSLI